MPNARKPGWGIGTFSAPLDLIADARAKAKAEGSNLSAVIRVLLERYVRSKR